MQVSVHVVHMHVQFACAGSVLRCVMYGVRFDAMYGVLRCTVCTWCRARPRSASPWGKERASAASQSPRRSRARLRTRNTVSAQPGILLKMLQQNAILSTKCSIHQGRSAIPVVAVHFPCSGHTINRQSYGADKCICVLHVPCCGHTIESPVTWPMDQTNMLANVTKIPEDRLSEHADKCEHANKIWIKNFDGKKSKCAGDKNSAC